MGGELEEDGEHGGLVKKILETKKELEGGNKVQNKEVRHFYKKYPCVISTSGINWFCWPVRFF